MDGAELPGTDEFIERCERVRAWNYCTRARGQAELGVPTEPAGSAEFGRARAWFKGKHARVHMLDETSSSQLDAIEAWLAGRAERVLFDVLPTVSSRSVASALAERGYRLVAWQPLLYRELSALIRDSSSAIDVEEVSAEDGDFRDTYLAGYEVASADQPEAARIQEARWRAEGARRFIARLRGKPVAAATLVVFEDVARLANCATRPEARRCGAQTALIRVRLECAVAAKLRLSISDARQGGESLRNLSRAGFAVCAQITQWSRRRF
jgi:hypothetical protein